MIRTSVEIQNKAGLHARAANQLVAAAMQFQSQIELHFKDQVADCRNIVSLMLISVKKGMRVELVISGVDETAAVSEILKLFKNKFGEE